MLGTPLTAAVGPTLNETSVVTYIFELIINKHTIIIWNKVFYLAGKVE